MRLPLALTLSLCSFLIINHTHAQTKVMNIPRVSPKASVHQTIGITEVVINYSRPAVRGRAI